MFLLCGDGSERQAAARERWLREPTEYIDGLEDIPTAIVSVREHITIALGSCCIRSELIFIIS